MTVNADAKIANIEGSLRQYVQTNLAASFSSGAAIDYGSGEPFDDTQYAEWLQVRLLEPARPQSMIGPRSTGTAPSSFGREMFHMLNLNIFVRPAKLTVANSLRLQTLRDAVATLFTPLTEIAVTDYAGASAALGNIVVDEIERDAMIQVSDRENELLQWTLLVSLRWTETWT